MKRQLVDLLLSSVVPQAVFENFWTFYRDFWALLDDF